MDVKIHPHAGLSRLLEDESITTIATGLEGQSQLIGHKI
jgi:hypothetical protein